MKNLRFLFDTSLAVTSYIALVQEKFKNPYTLVNNTDPLYITVEAI